MVCEKLGVQENESPGKYLGIPMMIGRNMHSIFDFLVEHVEQKLQTWSAQSISKEGKVTLLKTASQSIPNFWMSLFLILGEICEADECVLVGRWW